MSVLVPCEKCAFPIVERVGDKIKVRSRLLYIEYGECKALCKECGAVNALPMIELNTSQLPKPTPERKFIVRQPLTTKVP